MTTIKDGYGEEELKLRFYNDGKSIGLWIEFGCNPKEETLSYLTLQEVLDLRDELNKIIKEYVRI